VSNRARSEGLFCAPWGSLGSPAGKPFCEGAPAWELGQLTGFKRCVSGATCSSSSVLHHPHSLSHFSQLPLLTALP